MNLKPFKNVHLLSLISANGGLEKRGIQVYLIVLGDRSESWPSILKSCHICFMYSNVSTKFISCEYHTFSVAELSFCKFHNLFGISRDCFARDTNDLSDGRLEISSLIPSNLSYHDIFQC